MMFESKEHRDMAAIVELAKTGNLMARDYLKKTYSLKIYTSEEVDRINELRGMGRTIEESINEVANQQEGE